MENKLVELTVKNNVGIVTINRPTKGNSIDLELAKELMNVVIKCSEREEIQWSLFH